MGIDVVGEDAVDTLLGPNRKKGRQNASLADGAGVNSQPEEERPAWDNTPVDMEACIDSHTSARYDIARCASRYPPLLLFVEVPALLNLDSEEARRCIAVSRHRGAGPCDNMLR